MPLPSADGEEGEDGECCVVCLERAATASREPWEPCEAGCRGRGAVCAVCAVRLRRCVFCRRALVPEDEPDEGDPPRAAAIATALALMCIVVAWVGMLAAFLALVCVTDDPADIRRDDARSTRYVHAGVVGYEDGVGGALLAVSDAAGDVDAVD
eukprot:jgi/Tetstr1/453999/TSEL_040918.t1